MLKADASHGKSCEQQKPSRSRQRTSTSCTECRRRKQKCNQAKDRPCNNCARRYPPVACEYAVSKSRYQETLLELEETEAKEERDEDPASEALRLFNPYGTAQAHLLLDIPLHGQYKQQSRSHASSVSEDGRSPYFGGSTFEIPILGYDGLQIGSESEAGDSHVDLRSSYYPYPEDCQNSDFGIMSSNIQSSSVEPLHSLPFEATRCNAELFHMFIERLSPYMTSIDGQNPVAKFNKEWMSFIIQSPIIAYIAILTSSYFQAIARGIDVEKSVHAIATRVKLIKLINEHLTTHSKGVNDEAIAAVMSLAYNELIYSDKNSVVAHMRGLREMIRTRGAIENISLSSLRKMLARTDYQVACTFECNPFIDDDFESTHIPIFVMYPLNLDSPLLQSRLRFVDSASDLQISSEAATVLDDMRFLTTSVISMTKDELSSPQEKAKFTATATWINTRLSAPTDPGLGGDFIYQSVRAVGTAYSAAILSRTPLSQACSAQNLRQLWMNMWRVPLSRWKQTPGIFFWVVLVVTPFARDKREGRFLKGMLAASTIAIGLVDWDVVMGMLRGFLAVQRWLAAGVDVFEALPEMRIEPPTDLQRRKSTSAI